MGVPSVMRSGHLAGKWGFTLWRRIDGLLSIGLGKRSTQLNQPTKQTKSMNTDIQTKSSTNQGSEAARELGRQAADVAKETAQHTTAAAKDIAGAVKDVAKDVAGAAKDTYQTLSSKVEEGVERTKEYAQHAVDATKDAAQRATDSAKDMYQSAAAKAEDALVTSKEYVRQNPFPVALGTLIAGLAIGCMIGMGHREESMSRRRFF
jgi:ElaB/YqjD/DUF883 family membrane-anchored ribosome-binding protein